MRTQPWIVPPRRAALPLVTMVVILALSACDADDTPTPLPTVDLEGDIVAPSSQSRAGGASVTASGAVVPLREVELAFPMGGLVETVEVRPGDRVEIGQLLAALEASDLEAAADESQRSLDELASPVSIAVAEKTVALRQQAVDDAQRKMDDLGGPSGLATQIRNLEGRIDLAEQELVEQAAALSDLQGLPDGDPEKAEALVAMTEAQLRLDALVESYLRAVSRPTEAEVNALQADVEAAEAALEEARWYVAALRGEAVPEHATGISLVQLERAKDELTAAERRVASTRLAAPIEGTVTVVATAEGEYASRGQVVIVVSDISLLWVETTDLSERDVVELEIDQEATVYLEALDEQVAGRVSGISPVADTLGGDVVYRVTVKLDSQPEGLRPGMSAEVRIDTSSEMD